MAERHAAVKNAADKRQTTRAARKERLREGDFLGYLRHALTSSAVRYVLAHLVFEEGLLFDSVFSSDPLQLAHRVGRQQFAQEIRDACIAADPELWLQLEREYHARITDDNFATDASHAAIDRNDQEE